MTVSSHLASVSSAMPLRIPLHLADRSYEILIQDGLIDHIGTHLRPLARSAQAVMVTTPVINRLYGKRVLRSLNAAGFKAAVITVPEGERAKSMRWLRAILDELVQRRCERDTWMIVLGGGVVGDLAGFAAATYLRGIPLVQVPTTLVAQVDASIGGKTAINHQLGKNLIGAFYQPKLVVIDPSTLRTLPVREYRAGLAEVIKYGVIQDADFFQFLERNLPRILKQDTDSLMRVLRTSCRIKAAVVAADEREGNRRRILNFGHTIGHALETVTRYRRYKHGEAVAIGMVVAAGLATAMSLSDRLVEQRIRHVVELAGLPTGLPAVSASALIRAMRQDKKVKDRDIHFVLPTEIGKVVVRPIGLPVIHQILAASRHAVGATRR